MRLGRLGPILFGVALACACAAFSSARAADGSMTARLEPEGYARIVFSFDRLPYADARIANGVLVVTFGEPVSFDPAKAAAPLGDLVSGARRDPTGSSIRIALNRPVKLNAQQAGESYYVDLLPQSWAGLPPPLPRDVIAALTQAAREARDAERRAAAREKNLAPLTISGATHPTFRRLVFTVDPRIDVAVTRAGDRAVVRIGAALPFDLAAARAGLPPELADLDARRGDGALTVTAPAPGGKDIRGFREDGTFVVDIDRDDADPLPQPTPVSAMAQGAAAQDPAIQGSPAQDVAARGAATQDGRPAAAPAPASPAAAPARPEESRSPSGAAPEAPSARRVGQTVRLVFPFARATPAAIFARGRVVWAVFDDPR